MLHLIVKTTQTIKQNIQALKHYLSKATTVINTQRKENQQVKVNLASKNDQGQC